MEIQPLEPTYCEPLGELVARGLQHDGVDSVLKAVRKHLDMDVAFVSRFGLSERVLEYVDSDSKAPLTAGTTIPLEQGYCLKIVRGDLPEFMPDTSLIPAAMAIPETHSIPIGSHLSAPIRLSNGDAYGTLCCFSHLRNTSLGERDMKLMRAFADVLAAGFDKKRKVAEAESFKATRIREALDRGAPRMVFQPIFNMATGKMAGLESLSRFDVAPYRPPNEWFDLADEVGYRHHVELCAVGKAVESLDELDKSVFVGINSSPDLVSTRKLAFVLRHVDLSRVVLEITEHATVDDYEALRAELAPLRARGLRLAIDDAGAGYSSMRHILSLHPDLIKLDMSITRDIDKDPKRRALAKALISFAHETKSLITAEGVETAEELEVLQNLGVDEVQGYFLGRPQPLQEAMATRTNFVPLAPASMQRAAALSN
ncbi:MAG TPA: EAL domain-containing protein [Acidobacteriaceae bacterium]|jgi:EAL domain-containing protein (putative c-di-GMP-specific phosphodiesterase class I)